MPSNINICRGRGLKRAVSSLKGLGTKDEAIAKVSAPLSLSFSTKGVGDTFLLVQPLCSFHQMQVLWHMHASDSSYGKNLDVPTFMRYLELFDVLECMPSPVL
jgi:hypothetical protein